jgi:hypothetical protein
MAFQASAGWQNLPNGNFVPTIFSKKVQKVFRKESVVEDITNSDYFGEIANEGDTVRILKEPEIVVRPLQRGTQIVTQTLNDEDFTLIINQSNYFAFELDDIEKQQAHVEWMDMASNRAAYRMRDRYDAEVLAYLSGYGPTYDANGTITSYSVLSALASGTRAWSTAGTDELIAGNKLTRATFVSGGSASESVAVGVDGTFDTTPLKIMNRVARLMNVNNVPQEGRWAVVDPVFAEILMDENSKLINNDYNPGASQLTNGKLAEKQIRGFTIYQTNNLPFVGTGASTADNNGSSANYGILMFGHKSAVATAQQLNQVEKFRSQDFFGDVCRGMHLYGRKILRPEALFRVWYNLNA